jgi:hypothetical protein
MRGIMTTNLPQPTDYPNENCHKKCQVSNVNYVYKQNKNGKENNRKKWFPFVKNEMVFLSVNKIWIF